MLLQEMPSSARRFALQIFCFALPVLIIVGLLEWAFWQTGESVPVSAVIARQQQNPKLVWLRAYFDQGLYAVKWSGFEARRPRIVALGSSRVMKFRAEMFGRDGRDFYNAGGMIQNVEDLNAFAEALTPQSTPRVALVGVDYWWLNEKRSGQRGLFSSSQHDAALDWRAHWIAWRKMFSKPAKNKPESVGTLFSSLHSPPFENTLGIQARIQGGGFRFDGSKSRGTDLPKPARIEDWEIKDDEWKKRIAGGEKEGVLTTGVSTARLKRLRQALVTLQKKGVTVLVFNPPLMSEHARLMNSIPQQKKLWNDYQTLVPQLCRELEIPFCDASTPQKLGLADYYMGDPVHAEETFHLHILRKWAQNPVTRRALPDVGKTTNAILASPRTHFWDPDYAAAPFASKTLISPAAS